jgi:hypothetical protein
MADTPHIPDEAETRAPFCRHAGLDPASRFFFVAPKGSGTPDHVRGDEREGL